MKPETVRKVVIAGMTVAIGSGFGASAVAAKSLPLACPLRVAFSTDATAAMSGTLTAHRIFPLCN